MTDERPPHPLQMKQIEPHPSVEVKYKMMPRPVESSRFMMWAAGG